MTCWDEAGRPSDDSPAVRNAAAAIVRLYDFTNVGGALHIVTDDWNVEDNDLDFCETVMQSGRDVSPELIASERECLSALRTLSIRERQSALALAQGAWGSGTLAAYAVN